MWKITGRCSPSGKSADRWEVVGSNPDQVKQMAYQMYTCHYLAWCSALIVYSDLR